MKQTIIYKNQPYVFLDYIALGTSNYLFIFNESSKDFKCIKENFLEEYSVNSSFSACEKNKISILDAFINQINPLIKNEPFVSINSLILSIKKLKFYIKESNLSNYISDKVTYSLSEKSLNNLNLFISKTIEVKDDNNKFYIKILKITDNNYLSFNNNIYIPFFKLDINENIYLFTLNQTNSHFLAFIKMNNNYILPSIDLYNPSILKKTINTNILINYFINHLNGILNKEKKVDLNIVINSIKKFINYLNNSELINCLSNTPNDLNTKIIIKLFVFFNQEIFINSTDNEEKTPTINKPNLPIAKPKLTYFQKEKKKKKFNTYTFILIASVIIAIIGIILLINWFFDSNKTNNLNDDIKDKVNIKESTEGEAVNPPSVNPPKESDYWRYMKMNLINVNFKDLLKINPDTVGWIKVNGTNINYPIVQSGDNNYYLHHAFNKSYNNAGWIFADYRNDLSNLSKNTVIYGHGRLDTTMFGSLKNILKSNWYKNSDNYVVKLSTPTQNTLWQVFSVYSIKAESYYITTDFPTTNQYDAFLAEMKKRSVFNFSADVNNNDKILTLSTCQDNYDNRVVMHAKLIKIENR